MRTGMPVLATPTDLRRLLAAGEVEMVGAPSLEVNSTFIPASIIQ
jgi:hypothetical protein